MLRTYTIRMGEASLHRGTILQYVAAVTKLWRHRSRTRRELALLGDDELRDIGLTRNEVRAEIAQPFWSPWPTNLSSKSGMSKPKYQFAIPKC